MLLVTRYKSPCYSLWQNFLVICSNSFTSLLVINFLVTRCSKIFSLFVANSFTSYYSLQKSFVAKKHSMLIAKVTCCKNVFIICCKISSFLIVGITCCKRSLVTFCWKLRVICCKNCLKF